jgi:hypothetical protein
MVRLPEPESGAARWSRRMAAFAVPLAVLTTLLHRFGHIETPVGLVLIAMALGLAVLAVLVGLFALVSIWQLGGMGARHAVYGIAVALMVLAWPTWQLSAIATQPAINDVTTDWQQPPTFRAAAEDRREWARDVAYRRDFVVRQAAAYPEIVPFFLSYSADLVFEAAAALVEQRGWRTLAALPPTDIAPGRIEAVARTLVFGFPDDVALRITPRGPEATRVDMRSASRYGEHDLGANAERIFHFLTDLQAILAQDAEPLSEEEDAL